MPPPADGSHNCGCSRSRLRIRLRIAICLAWRLQRSGPLKWSPVPPAPSGSTSFFASVASMPVWITNLMRQRPCFIYKNSESMHPAKVFVVYRQNWVSLFIRSFVKEIEVKPGKAAIVFFIPTLQDSPIGGANAVEVALNGGVRSTVRHGGPGRIRTCVAVTAPDLQSGGINHSPTDPDRHPLA